MEAALFVWFVGMSQSIVILLTLFGLVVVVATLIISIVSYIDGSPSNLPPIVKFFLVPLGCLSLIIAAIIPSEKTLYMMVGAYFGQKAIQSEMADDVYKMIQKKLKTYVESPEEAIKDGKKISGEATK